MTFSIKKLLIWPKDTSLDIREISFLPGCINLITGGSETGKSAIISIMDYCLGSNTCRIPTKHIRDYTSWFGLLIDTGNNNELLLIRKEPGDAKASGDMVIKEGSGIQIPKIINENTIVNYQQVKHRLNNIAGLPYIDFKENERSGGFDSRPSFRDLVSMIFQPQYIIANQSSLFYKADSFKHRKKLSTIFPYLLGAVDNKYLQLKEELKDLERELSNQQNLLEKRKKSLGRWSGEIKSNYMRALEFGLLEEAPYPEDNWSLGKYVGYLRGVKAKVDRNEVPLIREGVTENVTNRIAELENKEIEIAHEIQQLRNRRETIKRLEKTNTEYRKSMVDQYGRLKGVGWFNEKIKKDQECPMCGSNNDSASSQLDVLISLNNEVVEKGTQINDNYTVLSSEILRLSQALKEKERELNSLRSEIKGLRISDNQTNRRFQTINSIYKFAGRIEAEIKNYDEQLDNSDLLSQITSIETRITEIKETINESVVQNKLNRSKRIITDRIKAYAELFKAENRDGIIELNHTDLTLNFLSKSGRWDALYQIGSGSNYMAYHISTLLALHEFFLRSKKHPVPNFIVLDQPTQVYFPETDKEIRNSSEDVQRVKRIFQSLSDCISRTNGNFQIIVLEHVGSYAWKDFGHMNLVKRWRPDENDSSLIPNSWIKDN